MNYFEYKITKKFDGYKIIDFFKYHKVSKKKIYEYTFKNMIKVNENFVNNHYTLKENDFLYLVNNEEVDYLPLKEKLDVLYEDKYLLIINKPKDIIIHPDDKSKNHTMVNIVANYYIENNIKSQVRFIHRLDYQTTGIMIFVKDFIMCSYYDYLLSNNEIKRYYKALVCGVVKKDKGILNYKIGKDRHHNQRRRVSETGDDATTNYEVVSRHLNFTLVKLKLETGRTHQIRVHMSYINHPLIGDDLYMSKIKSNRVMLHSSELEIIKPLTDEVLSLECNIPSDMIDYIKNE